MNANQLEAVQLCRDAQTYEGEAQHASAGLSYVIYKNGEYTVYDNGEAESTTDTSAACKMLADNIAAAKLLEMGD